MRRGGEAVVVRGRPLFVLVALVEALALLRVLPVSPGLTHEVALPPFDLIADVGVVMSRAPSVPVFVLGVVAAVTARAALLAWMLDAPRRLFTSTLRFYLVALIPAYVAGQLVAAGQIILYAVLVWAGVLVAIVTGALLAAVPWRSGRVRSSLHESLVHGARVPTILVYVGALAALGAAARRGGDAAQLGAVVVSAAITLVAARRLARPGPRALPYRAVGIALVVVLLGVTVLRGGSGTRATPHVATRAGSLMLVPGIDTSSGHGTLFDLDPRTLGFSCAQTFYFSYRGTGTGAPRKQAICPIRTGAPYGRADTERPLAALEATFRAQVADLPAPVTVLTHSSGGWVAWAGITSTTHSPVRRLVMFAPLADPLGFPRPGRSGPGLVAGAGARFVAALGRRAHFSTFRPDAPLALELLGSPATLARLLDRKLPPGVHALAVPAAFDLALLVGRKSPFPRATKACPVGASHSALVTDPATATVVRTFLAGRGLPACPPWRTWEGALATGFRIPDRVR